MAYDVNVGPNGGCGARDRWNLGQGGKDYVENAGDVLHFKFNV